jgi:hypothetical protein
MKPLHPASDRFDKKLRNTRYELGVNSSHTKSNHFIRIPVGTGPLLVGSLSQSSFTVSGLGQSSIIPPPGEKPAGLHSYGEPTFNTEAVVGVYGTPSSDLLGLQTEKSKKENPLRPPQVDYGALTLPAQQPPPAQPQGPVPIRNPSAKMHISRSSTGLSQFSGPSSGPESPAVSPKHLRRAKLSSIDLLQEVGDEIDMGTLAPSFSYDAAGDRRLSYASAYNHSSDALSPSAAPYAGFGERPYSAGLPLVDLNRMASIDAPPSPTANPHQQDLTLQMKLAYLSIPSGTNEGSLSESRSRPASRAKTAPKTPVSLSTQVLRLPTAVLHEPSITTDVTGEAERHQVGSRCSGGAGTGTGTGTGGLLQATQEGSLMDLKMGSELGSSTVFSSKVKTPKGPQRAGPTTTQVAGGELKTPLRAGKAEETSQSPSRVRENGSVSPILQQRLSPEQLQGLQQPHYQDERFQQCPREVFYKYPGHVAINTTPYPEEVAHLTLHAKRTQPLPQYLRAQLAEQQRNYQHKAKVLSSTRAKPTVGVQTVAPGPAQQQSANLAPAAEQDARDFVALRPEATGASMDGVEDAYPPHSAENTTLFAAAIFEASAAPQAEQQPAVPSSQGPILAPQLSALPLNMTDDLESRTATANPNSGRSQQETSYDLDSELAPGNGSFKAVSFQSALTVEDDDVSLQSGGERIEESSVRSARSLVSVVSAHSRASSPDGSNKRSLSIRITSTGNMYEVNVPSQNNSRSDSPLMPLVISVGSTDQLEHNIGKC